MSKINANSALRKRIETALGKRIVTSHIYPPIPIRTMDWCAYPDGEEEDGRYGWGVSEEAALADLAESLVEDDRLPENFNELPS